MQLGIGSVSAPSCSNNIKDPEPTTVKTPWVIPDYASHFVVVNDDKHALSFLPTVGVALN